MSEVPKQLRKDVFKRESGFCFVCRIGKATDFHHRQRRRDGGHTVENGIAVCRSCHSRIHNQPKWARDNGWIVEFAEADIATIPTVRWGVEVLLSPDGTVERTAH